MTVIIPEPTPVSPFVLKDVDLVLEDGNYAAHCSEVSWRPTAATQTWKGLTPSSVYTDVTSATWAATLTFAQDYDDDLSLSSYLLENEGKKVPATFVPRSGSGKGFAAELTLTPGQIGGAVDAFGTATVTLGSTKPQRVTTSPVDPA